MVASLCTKYPDKAPKFWSYQSTILRAAQNYEGKRGWVAYVWHFWREALTREALNQSSLDTRLSNEATFTRRVRSISRC